MRLFCLAVLLLGTAPSCSLVLPANGVQCNTTDDCIARGFGADALCKQQVCEEPQVDPIWGCLGEVEEPAAIPGETHRVSHFVVDALTGEVPPGLAIRLCASVDLACDSPVIEEVSVTPEGRLDVTVTSGFQGYFEMDADGMMPTLLPIGPVVQDSDPTMNQLELARTAVIESLAGALGLDVDPTKGHTLLRFTACDGFGRAGVSFSHEPATGEQFFLIGLSPDTMTETTDDAGSGGVLNLEPGFVNLTSTRNETGEFIARRRVLIRPGHMTYLIHTPTPAP